MISEKEDLIELVSACKAPFSMLYAYSSAEKSRAGKVIGDFCKARNSTFYQVTELPQRITFKPLIFYIL